MSKYTYPAPEHYAVSTTKWRQEFDQYNTLQGEIQLDAAESWIYKLKTSNAQQYEQFMADARAWIGRETARIKEKQGPAPVTTTNTFHLGIARPLDTGTTRCAEIKTSSGATYNVEFAREIKNLVTGRKMPENQPVIFIPYEKYYDPASGERRDPWASDVHLLPCEADSRMENLGIEGLRLVSFIIILKASGLGHIYDSTYTAAKLKFLAPGTTKLTDLLQRVAKKFKADGVFGLRYSSVSYEQIAPDSSDPLNIAKTGRYFSQVGLPWSQIGAPGKSNPGVELNENKTLDENPVTEQGIVFCEAYKPGNHLTAYGGAGKPDIAWYDVVLDIIT